MNFLNSSRLAVFSLACAATFLSGCAGDIVQLAPPGTPVYSRVDLPRPVTHMTQTTSNTCWLACAAMIYNYRGVNVTEQQLGESVKAITFDERDATSKASERECLIALAQKPGWHEEFAKMLNTKHTSTKINIDPGKILMNGLKNYTDSIDELVSALVIDKEPAIIVCKMGQWTEEEHAMVVMGCEVGVVGILPPSAGGNTNLYAIVSLTVQDPADPSGQPSKKSSEYLKTNLRGIYTRHVAEQMLADELDAIKINYN